jgi:thiosulfate/3-mercaptopyruvate sulfurtransferase
MDIDRSDKIQGYAHPEALVSTEWVEQHLGDQNLRLVESNEDILLYDTGHIKTAIKLDWHTELNHPLRRDYLEPQQFAELMKTKGIDRQNTVVIYGDRSNWWATYAFWVFKLFGHEDVRIMDGGRTLWISEGRELTTNKPEAKLSNYPVVERNDNQIRAFRDEVLSNLGKPLIDVRSNPEYTGERLHMADFPNEGATVGGHIPTAVNIPWSTAAAANEAFLPKQELETLYFENTKFDSTDDFIAYCRIGERSSHTWFVLKYLLGVKNVKNYDGSWTEWGNLVGVPVVKGEQPGEAA